MAWLLAIPRTLVRAARRASRLQVQRLAASVAFYALFSLPALLVVVIDLAGTVFGEEAARARLVAQVTLRLGEDLASTVDSVIAGAVSGGAVRFLPRAVTFFVLFFGASLTFVELQYAMNRIWSTASTRRWFVAVALKRLLSFAMVLLVGVFLVSSTAASVVLARFGTWSAEHLPRELALGLVRWLEPLLSLATLTLQFALLFKVLPDGHVPWKRAWVGAVATATMLVTAKEAVSLYVGFIDPGSVYGAAGSVVALLVWVYASSVIVLLGGTIALAWEEVRSGDASRGGPTPAPPGA